MAVASGRVPRSRGVWATLRADMYRWMAHPGAVRQRVGGRRVGMLASRGFGFALGITDVRPHHALTSHPCPSYRRTLCPSTAIPVETLSTLHNNMACQHATLPPAFRRPDSGAGSRGRLWQPLTEMSQVNLRAMLRAMAEDARPLPDTASERTAMGCHGGGSVFRASCTAARRTGA